MSLGLIHSCTITTRTSNEPTTQNEFGEPEYPESVSTSDCRFFYSDSQPGNFIEKESGVHLVTKLMLILPASAVIIKGSVVTSTDVGFEGPYKVVAAERFYRMRGTQLHHQECILEGVE